MYYLYQNLLTYFYIGSHTFIWVYKMGIFLDVKYILECRSYILASLEFDEYTSEKLNLILEVRL